MTYTALAVKFCLSPEVGCRPPGGNVRYSALEAEHVPKSAIADATARRSVAYLTILSARAVMPTFQQNNGMELTLTLILLLGLIVFITQTLEGITGFGSTVLALPFAAMILGIDKAVPILATHTWLLALYFVIVSWKQIVWKEFGFIALYVFIGLPIGYSLFKNLDDTYLKILLSLFMIGVGINGIYITRRSRHQTESSPEPVKKSVLMRFILFLGGVVHGAFASGGPFIVLYASRALKEKALFRVTMCLLWLCLNTMLMIGWTVDGRWTPDVCYALGVSLPFLLLGIFVGDYLHRRANEYAFRLIVFALLVGGGLVVMSQMCKIVQW